MNWAEETRVLLPGEESFPCLPALYEIPLARTAGREMGVLYVQTFENSANLFSGITSVCSERSIQTLTRRRKSAAVGDWPKVESPPLGRLLLALQSAVTDQ